MDKLVFVAHERDAFAIKVLDILRKQGYETKAIDAGFAGEKDIAIFSLNGNGEKVHFPNRHARLAAHRLLEAGVVPEWASATPYLACVKEHPNEKLKKNLKNSVEQITFLYEEWFAGIRGCACPWGCEPKGMSVGAFNEWEGKFFGEKNRVVSSEARRFLRNLDPLNHDCLLEAVKRADGASLKMVSAFCIHANSDRSRVVDSLDSQVKKAFRQFLEEAPIESLKILTFSPDDLETLDNYDMLDIVLPALREKPDELKKNWDLSLELVSSNSKIELLSIKELFTSAQKVMRAKKEAADRADEMYLKIQKNEPPIFKMLSEPEKKSRLRSEATTYLLMTERFSDLTYLGFEVHADYWRSGQLYKYGEKFLPVLMAPPILRQHFSSWYVDKDRRSKIKKIFG